jgi:hypothetical protein
MGTDMSKQVLYKHLFTSCIVIIYNTNSIQLHKRTQMNHLKNVLLSVFSPSIACFLACFLMRFCFLRLWASVFVNLVILCSARSWAF